MSSVRRAAALASLSAAIGVSLVSVQANALTRRTVLWSTNVGVDHVYPLYGIGSCEQARAIAMQNADLFCKTYWNKDHRPGYPPDVVDLGTQCGNTSGNNTLFELSADYRCADDFPTTPNKTIGVNAYCDGFAMAPQWDAQKGYFCDAQDPAPGKSIGCGQDCDTGNPVSPGYGNKRQAEVDYVGQGPFPLRLVRTYNSRANMRSLSRIGADWTHNYAMALGFGGPNASTTLTVSVDRPDGRILYFNLSSGVYVGDPDMVERLEKTATGWSFTTANDEVERYDANGKLLSITNRIGLVHTLSYFASGNYKGLLEKVTDSFGRSLVFGYSTDATLKSVTDPAGGTIVYTQSTETYFNLLTKTDQSAGTRKYFYELAPGVANGLTGILDENGPRGDGARYATYWYEPGTPSTRGTANQTQHWGRVDKYTFTFPSATTRDVTENFDANTTITRTYTFESIQGVPRIKSITGPVCPQCGPKSTTYDAKGNVASTTDWNGNKTTFTYDARNLETSRTEAVGTAIARTTSREWHPTQRLLKRIAVPRRIVTLTYNGDGGTTCGFGSDGVTPVPGVVCSARQEETTDTTGAAGFSATTTGTPRIWSFTYDENGQVLSVDGPRTDVDDQTVYAYYAASVTCAGSAALGCRGRPSAIADAFGHLTQFLEYDAHGNPLKIVDPNGTTVTLTYDAMQRVTSRSFGSLVTSYTYDKAGLLTKTTLPDASFLQFAYDGAQRLVEVQDNGGNRVVFTLDFQNNRLKEEVYDASSALTQTRKRVYSSLNRLMQEIGAQNQTTNFAYDSQGNLTSVTDPLGRVTTRSFDALNRLVKVIDPMPTPGQTLYGYDAQDNVASVTDPRGLVTSYTFDGFGSVTQVTSPDTGTRVATYDVAGNVSTRTDAKGQKTETYYDALQRPTVVKYADGSQAVYTYDDASTNGIGRLGSTTDKSGTRSYGYDDVGRLLSETLAVSAGPTLPLVYKYDAAGHMTEMTYPSGRTVKYAYDALGRISQVLATGNATTTIADLVTYRPFGPVSSWKTQGGAVLTRTFDQDGRMASYSAAGKAWNIGYDAASQITSITDAANGLDARTYGYDPLGRLIAATTPAGSETYAYDAAGNRTARGAQTLTYAASNQRLMQTSAPDPRTYAYDANGSPTGDGTRTFEYDARGRLVKASDGEVNAEYSISTNGARVAKKVTR